MPIPRAEQETTITIIHPERLALCWTCNPVVARHWTARGWPVTVFGTAGGEPISWQAKVASKAISFRRLSAPKAPRVGAVIHRKGQFQRKVPA